MANHLTPEELSKEIGIDREEVIRICIEEHVPIYHGKIDKTLFQAQLAATQARSRRSTSAHAQRRAARRARAGRARSAGGARACPRLRRLPRGGRLLRRRPSSSPAAPFDDAATEARSASIRSITGVSVSASSASGSSRPSAFAASSSRSWARYSLRRSAGSNSPCRPPISWWASASSSFFTRRRRDGLVDLGLALHVLGDVERLERERVALRADQAELLLAGEHERADADDAVLAHRLEQQRVRAALRLGAGGHEVVGAVEVDGVDLVGADEARDLDRARGVALLERLELLVLDRDELALRRSPSRARARRARPRRRGRGTSASA